MTMMKRIKMEKTTEKLRSCLVDDNLTPSRPYTPVGIKTKRDTHYNFRETFTPSPTYSASPLTPDIGTSGDEYDGTYDPGDIFSYNEDNVSYSPTENSPNQSPDIRFQTTASHDSPAGPTRTPPYPNTNLEGLLP
eukprot:UN04390